MSLSNLDPEVTANKKVLRREVITMADMLAKNLRLDNMPPAGTDFSDKDTKELQTQLHAINILPLPILDPIYLAFTAKYLPTLIRALRTLSRETQRKAFSQVLQVLTLVPPCRDNPYLRKFLQSPAAAGLPNLVAQAFCDGVDWLRPSGPGHICHTMTNMLFWCDISMGDDGKAAMDKAVREKLARKLAAFQASAGWSGLSEFQRAEIERLAGVLKCVEDLPGASYLASTQEFEQGSIPGLLECSACGKDEDLFVCSRCKSERYCSKECQAAEWKDIHVVRCFEAAG